MSSTEKGMWVKYALYTGPWLIAYLIVTLQVLFHQPPRPKR